MSGLACRMNRWARLHHVLHYATAAVVNQFRGTDENALLGGPNVEIAPMLLRTVEGGVRSFFLRHTTNIARLHCTP